MHNTSNTAARAAVGRDAAARAGPGIVAGWRARCRWPGRSGPGRGQPSSSEDDRAAAMQQDAVLRVPAHRACQRGPLGVAAERRELLRAAGVIDPDDFLLDDRALVEIG